VSSDVGRPVADSEEINSDLDDSDSEAEEEDQEGSVGDTDIVFCTYDKVWKHYKLV
jgi:transcription initiation factor TFIIA large subunit